MIADLALLLKAGSGSLVTKQLFPGSIKDLCGKTLKATPSLKPMNKTAARRCWVIPMSAPVKRLMSTIGASRQNALSSKISSEDLTAISPSFSTRG